MAFLHKKNFLFSLCLSIALCVANVAFATFERGDEGQEVLEIQKSLAALSYKIDLDGQFGPGTEKVIKQFQKDRKLEVDGIVGPATYRALLNKEIPVSRGDNSIRRVIRRAYSCMGAPYVFGANGPYAFDCSSFVKHAFAAAGVSIPRMADEQYYYGRKVPVHNLRRGDIVFFTTYEPGASHCGIYLGDGKFIHAGSSTGVTVADVFGPYWGCRYYGACRIL